MSNARYVTARSGGARSVATPGPAATTRAASAPHAISVRRVALYSHDTMGLGHVRRNILLAGALVQPPLAAEVLLLSGIREAGAFTLPPGIDSVTLPAYRKALDGTYHPRALGTDLQRLVRLRGNTIATALREFVPDLLVVDNVPRGALDELDHVLPLLERMGTRVVLGLRDVIDTARAVRSQWARARNPEAIRQYFDAIWIYGDRRVHETALDLDETSRNKTAYVGYLDQRRRGPTIGARCETPYVLCAVGGGQDGIALTEAFAQARMPRGHHGVILSGAMMPAEARARLHRYAAQRDDLRVLEFASEPLGLIAGAASVVAMGGYNTTTEILSLGKRALIVPRVVPRQEQWIRARRLAGLGLVDCVHPDQLTVDRLSRWMAGGRELGDARSMLNFGGLDRVCQLAGNLIGATTPGCRDAA